MMAIVQENCILDSSLKGPGKFYGNQFHAEIWIGYPGIWIRRLYDGVIMEGACVVAICMVRDADSITK
jgi:hypothetical protein